LGDYGHRYSGENHPHGAVLSYYLPEGLQTLKEQRREAEKARAEDGGDNPYPSWDALRAEDSEESPTIILTIRDADGELVRRLEGPVSKGFHRVTWDLRYPAPDAVNLNPPSSRAPWSTPPQGPLALPGEYSVSLSQRHRGVLTELDGPVSLTLKPLHEGGTQATDRSAVLAFQMQTAELQRELEAANGTLGEMDERIKHLVQAVIDTPAAAEAEAQSVRDLRDRLIPIRISLSGDRTVASRAERTPMSLSSRIGDLVGNWTSQSAITQTHRDSFSVASEQLQTVVADLRAVENDLGALERRLESMRAPWTPGRGVME
jgi:hypothetical protein